MMINLRALRKQRGLTMKQLGAAIGVAESTVSLYESGKRSPDIETLMRIADCFDISIDSLCGRKERETRLPKEQEKPLLSAIETELLSAARKLNEEGLQKLIAYANDLTDTGKYIKENQPRLVQKAKIE